MDDELIDFLKDKNVYFYTDHVKIPYFDVLYIKVNDNYFIREPIYFDKITEYYFNLYCSVFSKLGLKKIYLLKNSDILQTDKVNMGLNLSVTNTSIDVENKNKTTTNGEFNMDFSNNSLFLKEIEKYSQLNDVEKDNHIYNYLIKNKHGEIVSRKKHLTAKKEKRLEKHGYFAQKGKFGFVKKQSKSKSKSRKRR